MTGVPRVATETYLERGRRTRGLGSQRLGAVRADRPDPVPLWLRLHSTTVKIGVDLPAAEEAGGTPLPSWADVRAYALEAEAAGLDSVWMFDHFFNRRDDGTIQNMFESWTILSAVASVTDRILLGSLVMCASFRNPGLLAKMAATLDEVSGGRLILGIGAGWYDPEYEAFGYPTDRRGTRYEETLAIVRRLLDGERVTFSGEFHQLRDAVLTPAPSRRIPILVAGDGPRVLRLAGRYGDAWNDNGFGLPDERLRTVLRKLDEALEAVGRDPATMERTIGVTVRHPDVTVDPDDEPAFQGSPRALAELFNAYADLGVDHLILEVGPKTVPSIGWIAEALDLFRR
jgi:probable F420-dependent oxidoreductase